MGGVRVVSGFMLVNFFPIESYFGIHLILTIFQLQHPPPLCAPGEPLYIGTWPFFSFLISLDPKEANSAKKPKSIFSTDSPLNQVYVSLHKRGCVPKSCRGSTPCVCVS